MTDRDNDILIAKFLHGEDCLTVVRNELRLSVRTGKHTGIVDYLPKYDKSWDALMPVVEKIEAIQDRNDYCPYFVEITAFECTIKDHNDSFPIAVEVEPTKIKATYKAVVNFVKWYNEQQSIKQ
jgi:hypothetical protein